MRGSSRCSPRSAARTASGAPRGDQQRRLPRSGRRQQHVRGRAVGGALPARRRAGGPDRGDVPHPAGVHGLRAAVRLDARRLRGGPAAGDAGVVRAAALQPPAGRPVRPRRAVAAPASLTVDALQRPAGRGLDVMAVNAGRHRSASRSARAAGGAGTAALLPLTARAGRLGRRAAGGATVDDRGGGAPAGSPTTASRATGRPGHGARRLRALGPARPLSAYDQGRMVASPAGSSVGASWLCSVGAGDARCRLREGGCATMEGAARVCPC